MKKKQSNISPKEQKIKDLEKENLYLRVELAYLKELRKLNIFFNLIMEIMFIVELQLLYVVKNHKKVKRLMKVMGLFDKTIRKQKRYSSYKGTYW